MESTEYSPESYTQATWLGAEAAFKGELVEPVDVPEPEPHPNEVATLEAARAGLYPVQEEGDDPLDAVGARDVQQA